MVSKILTVMVAAACMLALAAAPAGAEAITGPHVAFVKSFTIGTSSGIGVVAGVSFDPTYTDAGGDYDRVYMVDVRHRRQRRRICIRPSFRPSRSAARLP